MRTPHRDSQPFRRLLRSALVCSWRGHKAGGFYIRAYRPSRRSSDDVYRIGDCQRCAHSTHDVEDSP